MRLDKMLAHMGVGSRKDVKQQIRKGKVTVNGKRVSNGKVKIDVENDEVLFQGERVEYRSHIYLMMNKPQGYLSATYDHYDETVLDLVPEDYHLFEPFPIGRLDKDTEGLLLLSNDGQLAHQLTSPNRAVKKVYYARVEGKVDETDQEAMAAGVILDDGYETRPAELSILKSDDISEVTLAITEGKFHQVKRMFKARGKKVIYLQRIQMGDIRLDKSLDLGSVRELTDVELEYCKSLIQTNN